MCNFTFDKLSKTKQTEPAGTTLNAVRMLTLGVIRADFRTELAGYINFQPVTVYTVALNCVECSVLEVRAEIRDLIQRLNGKFLPTGMC